MLYPVYVHPGDAQHAHGVTIPDFPWCFSAADEWTALPAQVQEAVEVYCEGEDLVIPPPTPLEELAAQPEYQGGVWLLVDIDLGRVNPKAIRLNISLPECLVRRIDDYAKAHHLSRSGFLARAASRALEQ
ncbi:type II toxin-antitoxin system HicB family antitoxin [uncultured Thiodictyon sp.]|jgi:predicted RNase H-like HicB family nuclease|uniref:type II toxin-antitoxin system HicB family antitoxin n=1 Tax=uncultured Thiodictyon sp. TaxID=1846217 RepID=UPI0025F67080|nr:type II toxin-antitoxin system HicB family antitoxin [uncultured Thiodictyon sp.]